LGCLSHTLWVGLGVAALLAASPVAILLLKVIGATYLLYLAFSILRTRVSGQAASFSQPNQAANEVASAEPATSYLLKGFVANAINPKVALFFLALLPQFVNPSLGAAGWQIAQLGVIFTLQTILLFGLLGLFAGSISERLKSSPSISRHLDTLAAMVFILLALALLLN
jgi:threonine/homoserine/homoserine lactone efflux protein